MGAVHLNLSAKAKFSYFCGDFTLAVAKLWQTSSCWMAELDCFPNFGRILRCLACFAWMFDHHFTANLLRNSWIVELLRQQFPRTRPWESSCFNETNGCMILSWMHCVRGCPTCKIRALIDDSFQVNPKACALSIETNAMPNATN